MNRKIEFRGKLSHSGEWVFGSLLKIDSKYHIVTESDMYEDGHHICQKSDTPTWVDPYTVGEFTGMRDRHGNKVFEGDVVDVYDFTSAYASKYRGVVKMYRGSWCVEYEDSIFDTVFHPMLFFDDFADRKTEVVGNIHNNPELLSTK
jgi:uncharacterized phage protein (TIGR01671 family)